MFRRNEKLIQAEQLDRFEREMLRAVSASEEELDAVADSPDLYEKVRLRIAVDERAWAQPRSATGLFGTPLRWSLAAAIVLILLAVAALLWLPRPSRETHEVAPLVPHSIPAPPPSNVDQAITPPSASTPQQPRHVARRRPRTDNRADEVATDFLPLTYIAGPAASDSGHVVRMNVPRSALIAMGFPMNVDRAGELVKADVFVGDDGLARAIRFVQ
jgi:hypothetical protein